MRPEIVVGLSGGVDSFVTALLLQQKGFRVVGVHLNLWTKEVSAGLSQLCAHLNIPLLQYDGTELFRQKVVDTFISEYLSGRTPNPCTLCNNTVKWALLRRAATEAGIEKMATGHYVRVKDFEGRPFLYKGVDPVKDQSYFLWGLSREILFAACTPLGDYTKKEVKAMAERCGYPSLAKKKESMGICFLEGRDYREFILLQLPQLAEKTGNIVDLSGKIIGRHKGLLNYTIGQKRDMPLKKGLPLYVARIDILSNTIVAAEKNELFTHTLWLEHLCFQRESDLYEEHIEIKVRGLGLNPEGYIRIQRESADLLKISLASPAWAVAPGQPAALYCGERLIGGGIISR